MAEPSPTPYKRQLGMALERLRTAAGKSPEDAAELLECSVSKVYRIERGHVSVRPAELRDLLDFYGAPQQERDEIEQLGREARRRRPRTPYGSVIPDWFRQFVHLEEAASEILVYECELIPGAL
ncbi:helix-turn-helix domain-containing protein [Gandjariella thermophila]|uniref:HTH cro/C1-type domain-containing protein n=1 Tax=Gandjariella thermophila TaxID=1931992 RepID=A0A4D4JFX4_9PSEU|nr:helix-turn-helix transcriptional regulator [Gandjariella thermophila]GDY33229.1 hypothetical protein GTS_48620 [Gandjariella thermophila]